MIVHPKFVDRTTTVIDIPKYSEFLNLYTYAHQILQYIKIHTINNRIYSDKETSTMYLLHIDDLKFTNAIALVQSRLEHYQPGTLPLNLTVPALATTLTQQMKCHPTSDTVSTAQASHFSDYSSLTASQYSPTIKDISILGLPLDDSNDTVNYTNQSPLSYRRPPYKNPHYNNYYNNKQTPPGKYNSHCNQNPPRRLSTTFKGNCHACGQKNHHKKKFLSSEA